MSMTPEQRQKIRENAPFQSKEELRKELDRTRKERDDWRWGYEMTEGILKSDPKWAMLNERFSDGRDIVAAKLAKELVRQKYVGAQVKHTLAIPDSYRELMEWLRAKPWRKVQWDGQAWIIRDEAMNREIRHGVLLDLLRSEIWLNFRKR